MLYGSLACILMNKELEIFLAHSITAIFIINIRNISTFFKNHLHEKKNHLHVVKTDSFYNYKKRERSMLCSNVILRKPSYITVRKLTHY